MEFTEYQKKIAEGYAPTTNLGVTKDAQANGKVFNQEAGVFEEKESAGMLDSFGEVFSASRQEGMSLVATLQRSISDEIDPNWRLNEEHQATLKELNPALQDFMLEADSENEWQARLESVELTQSNQMKIAEHMGDNPVTSVLAMLSAGLLTEENLALSAGLPLVGTAAGALSAGASTVKTLKTVSDVANMAVKGKTALGTGVKNAGIATGFTGLEGTVHMQHLPGHELSDVITDMAASAVLVGGLGYGGHKLMGEDLPVEVEEVLDVDKTPINEAVTDVNRGKTNWEKLGEEEQGKAFWGTNWASKFLSDGARLRNSENKVIRGLARALVQEYRVNGKTTNIVGASQHQKRINTSAMVRFGKATRQHYNEWKRSAGKGLGFMEREDAFYTEVNKAIRSDAYYDQAHPSVRKAADGVRPIYQDLLRQKKTSGVKGSDNVEFDRNYVPTDWDVQKAKNFKDKFGFQQVATRLFAPAIARMNPEWSPALTRKIASMFAQRISRLDVDSVINGKFSDVFDDMSELRKMMEESSEDFSLEEMESVFKTQKTDKGSSKDVNLKRRLRMDYDFEVELKAKDGTLQKVSLNDLLNNNAHDLMQSYSFKAGRHIGLARNNIDSIHGDSWEDIVEKAKKYDFENGGNGKIEEELAVLKNIYEVGLRGADFLGTDPTTRGWLQGLRNLTYLAYSGFFGASAVIEGGSIIGYHGLRALFGASPAFKEILRTAKTGKLKGEELNYLEDMLGVGSNGFRGATSSRMDELGTMQDLVTTRAGQVAAVAREKYAKFTLLTPITDMLQRLNMSVLREQWIKGEIPKAMRQGSGITDDMYRRIRKQIKQHSKGRELGLKNWTDPKAKEAFEAHLSVEIRANIQETDLGTTNRLMRSQFGQSLLQFMSFLIGSNEMQGARLRGRLSGDMKVAGAKVVMAQMMIASMVHILRSYASSAGRSDERDRLEEKLSAEGIVLGTLNYTGAFGLLSMMAGLPQTVKNMAYGGLGTSTLNNPTIAYLDNISNIVFDLYENGELDERGLRAFLHSIPGLWNIYTVTGLNMISNKVGN